MQRATILGLALAVGLSSAAAARDGFDAVKLSEAGNDEALAQDIGAVLAGSIDRANAADPDNPVKVIAAPVGDDQAVVMLANNSALCKPEGCLLVVFNKSEQGWAPFWGVHANGWIELAQDAGSDTVAYVEGKHGCQVMLKGEDESGRPVMGATYPWPCSGHDAAAFNQGWSALQAAVSKAGSVCQGDVKDVVADAFDATIKLSLRVKESDCLKRELANIASLSGEQQAAENRTVVVAYRPAVGAAFYHQTPSFDLSLPAAGQ